MYRLLIVAILITSSAGAQVKAGKVIYERKTNMHKDLPAEAEQFKARIPEFQTAKMELLFNATQSLFHPLPVIKEDQLPDPMGDRGRRNFMFGGSDGETFRDYEAEKLVDSRELGPKKYIIEDSLRGLKWKLEEDTLTILGYLCHKATTTQPMQARGRRFMPGGNNENNEQNAQPQEQPVVVWYTEAIESQAGPDVYFGLPGLILKTDLNNGSMVYTALSIEKTDNKDIVKAPTNGKKITREEYRKMMADQMRSMGRPGGRQMTRMD